MFLCPFSMMISLYFILHHVINPVASYSPALYYPPDNIAVNCGSTGNSTASDGRKWIGDINSKYITSHGSRGKLMSLKAIDQHQSPDPVPYMTARISHSQFSYTFQGTPGQKFIRLHFYPASYRRFKRSKAFFSVKVGRCTLLSNFSASLAADVLGLRSFSKEFCVNVEENQPLVIKFSPVSGGPSDEVYAFVNGIEIVSMPTGLYHTKDGDPGAPVLGNKYQFPIDKSIALEMVQRLNVGGRSILSKYDTGMFREWSADSNYLLQSSVLPDTTTSRIKYTEIPAYVAPQNVYQTSWSMDPGKQVYKPVNFTWKLPVDLGFRYLLRIHFCELEYEIKESGNMQFSILFNEEVAETNADVMKWSGGNGVAVYRDYVVIMEGDRLQGKRDLLITLFPHRDDNQDWYVQIDAILKGDGVTYCGEKIGEKDMSSSPSEGLCRRFSLAEILSATNNFDDELVVGRGGFGKVYKAVIDGGATTVTIKRLNSKSKQGAGEFWTEIKMIFNLRHTHLVSLIGYCDERPEMILVYEYMEYGTLADHLYKINTDCNGIICHLSWEQRLNICIGAARGLDYLHTGTRHGIIHRDVKTTNILLDKDRIAKISDFGLCKLGPTSRSRTHVSTDVKGTFGYFDPAYFQTRRLTKKSDVYAFGVVMLEVLCGRPAVDRRLDGEQHSLVLWAQHCMTEKKLDQIVHPSLRDEISPKCLMVFVEVASKCLHSLPNERPTMADVVVSLECALASNDASDDQHSGSFTEEDNSASEEVDEQIDDRTQLHNALQLATVPSPSTLAQHNENSHRQKRSKGKFSKVIQRSFAFLAKGMDIRKKKRDYDSTSEKSLLEFGSTSGRLKRDNDTYLCRSFSLEEILRATHNFDESLKIGDGGFGKVYKGRINHGTIEVAIKRSTPYSSKQGVHEFMTEIHSLSQLRHRHLVSLIGYCNEDCEMILIYEYMSRGTLRDHLYNSDNLPLSWKKRLEICIGAARGLHYLHAGANRTIIHRDVKTTNILLDDNWVAKVADFGLSKENWNNMSNTQISTAVMGSFGYMDPEYFRWLRLTEKSDVYSFGVVLFEVLCARHPLDKTLERYQVNLAEWGRISYKNGTLDQIIDANIKGEIAVECLNKYVEIAVNCLCDMGIARPSMGDVLWNLEYALSLQETTDDKTQRGWDTTESMDHDVRCFNNEDDEMIASGGHMSSDGVEQVLPICSGDRLYSGPGFSEIMDPSAR
ncbi:Receptor-like protein kinase [Actinidia chinensis var. chinensis]|uniref:Receptor-like protein kinase n=1 Tax=Actinidia chinensis var. chinensis TaxID=1590841 RepID=A0A2R6RKH6_ACTCC|nr:Receptor-like protein kinase [Actinidia chinensis var. chinensis]